MPDYQNSKIYKLVSNKTSDIYIGSCLMRLSTRLSQHKNKNNKCVSRNLFVDDAIITIVLVESFPCTTKNELKARELYHIRTNNCININKPFVCDILYGDGKAWNKEYHQANKEHISANQKEYYQANKVHISANQKEYYQANKEHLRANKKEYHQNNKECQKEYNASHRDQINACQRALYAKKKLTKNLESTLNNNIVL